MLKGDHGLPKVAIIIPFYQHDAFLRDSVDSALAQTTKNIEVIVVDDCSPGLPAADILGAYSDARLKIERTSRRCGVSAARNEGIRLADAEYFFPLDSDDLMEPGCIADLLGAVESGYSGAFPYTQVFGSETWIWKPEFKLPQLLVNGAPGAVLFNQNVVASVGGYREDLTGAEDLDFFVTALENGHAFACVEKPLYHYRKHSANSDSKVCWLPGDLIANHQATIESYAFEVAQLYEIRRAVEEDELFDQLQRHNRLEYITRQIKKIEGLTCAEELTNDWHQCLARACFRRMIQH
jgi:glycosyltransferase involved in cell wall biosynthesis